MKLIDILAAGLLVLGGLNWGMVGTFGVDAVQLMFGGTIAQTVIYITIGAAAVWQGFGVLGIKERWKINW